MEWKENPDSKVHGANMGPIWVLSAPEWPHVGPMNLAIREGIYGKYGFSACMNSSIMIDISAKIDWNIAFVASSSY